MLRTELWGNAPGTENHSETITVNQITIKLLSDGVQRRRSARKDAGKTGEHSLFPVKERILESIVIQPGGHHEPKRHPNTAQMDFVISGEARIAIFGPGDEPDVRYACEGEVAHIPLGHGHWIENMSVSSLLFVLVMADEDA